MLVDAYMMLIFVAVISLICGLAGLVYEWFDR
jgi:hypothetical protein